MTDHGAANAGANPRARAPNHAVRVGDCVTVGPKHRVGAQNREGGVGFVVARHDNTKFDLKYSISNRFEKFVSPRRVRCLNPLAVTARQTDASVAERPSIISLSHRPAPRPAPAPAAAVARSASAGSAGVSAIILRSKQWTHCGGAPNPLMAHLRAGRKKPKGWLRRSEAQFHGIELVDKKGKEKKQLSPAENRILVHVKEEVDRALGLLKGTPDGYAPMTDIQHAFGVGKSKVKECVQKYYNNNADASRKRRSDAELTIFNSDKRRKEKLTPYEFYKRSQRKRHRESISDEQLLSAYRRQSPEVLLQCEHGAESMRRVVANIHPEIEGAMKKTNGVLSWSSMAEYIAGGPDRVQAVCKDALRRYVMGTRPRAVGQRDVPRGKDAPPIDC